jgi:hypothetical protein
MRRRTAGDKPRNFLMDPNISHKLLGPTLLRPQAFRFPLGLPGL